MKNPCLNCPRRKIGCHSSCPDYGKYTKYLAKKKALIKKSRAYDDYIRIKKYAKITNDLKESVRKR